MLDVVVLMSSDHPQHARLIAQRPSHLSILRWKTQASANEAKWWSAFICAPCLAIGPHVASAVSVSIFLFLTMHVMSFMVLLTTEWRAALVPTP